MPKNILTADSDLPNWPVEWLRIVSLDEAERLSGVSGDTLRRRYPDKIVRISERRIGIRVGDALMLSSPK